MTMKKTSALVMALMLVIQCFYGNFMPLANAAESIITDVNLTVKDAQGNTVTDAVYEQGSDVTLDYKWELPNGHGYKSGDTFTFELPEEFLLFNDITDQSLLIDGDIDVGTFTVYQATHDVVMTFNDYIESHDNVQGTITINTKFDKTKITGSTKQEILFPIQSGDKIITLNFKPYVDKTIEKSGVPQGFNANSINWTVDVNKALDSVENAVVTDPIPAGLDTPVSVAVYQLGVNLDGSVEQGAPVDSSKYTVNTTGSVLTVSFNESPINTAYRIQYTTSITDESKSSFTNTATFKGNNKSPVESSATVSVERGKPLEKTSTDYDPVSQTISWAIDYNYDERTIAQVNAKLTDLFNDTQELVAGSVKVYPVALDSTGNESLGSSLLQDTDYTVTPTTDTGKNGFILQFNNDVSSAYKIEYQTKAIDRVTADNTTITNTVTSEVYSDSATRGIYQVILNKNVGAKDYINKTVEWNIVLNQDNYTMKNVVFTDTFPDGGLQFIPDSLVVKDKDGNPVTEGTVYSVVYNNTPPLENEGFEIHFNSDISGPYTISYKTTFNNDWITGSTTNFNNHARIDWIDEFTNSQYQEITKTFTPRNEVKNNGFKYGSYNAVTKELTWTVGVNYNGKTIANAEVVDNLPVGQTLVPESLKVYNMNIAADGNPSQGSEVPSDDYTVNNVDNQLSVKFNNPINSPYFVVFRTSLEGQLIDSTATNTAKLLDGTTSVSKDLTASVAIPKGGEYVNKNGQQSGDKINWTVNINWGQSYVRDAKITDTPSSNQILLPDSFHLYGTTVASNGDVTKDTNSELVKDTDYTLAIKTDADGNQTFDLSFKNDITTPYILEYQSLIVASNGDKVTNTVGFSGNNVTEVTKETSKDVIVGVSSGSGTGSGVRGTLTVKKVDEADNTSLLNGATFTLYRLYSSDRIFINSLTTGAEGTVEFKNLLSGDYILQETAAPAGYELDSTEHAVTINSTVNIIDLDIPNQKLPSTPPTDPGENTPPEDNTPTDPGDNTPPEDNTPSDSGNNTSPGDNTPPSHNTTPVPPVTQTSGDTQQASESSAKNNATQQDTSASGTNKEALGGNANSSGAQSLPQTGESSHLYLQLTGLGLIFLGIVLRRRFKHNK